MIPVAQRNPSTESLKRRVSESTECRKNMEHHSAIENHTAERYLMGDLNEVERDAYEEHFFSCPVCAEEIKSASEFIESAKRVVHEELRTQAGNKVSRRRFWAGWLNWRSMLHPVPVAICVLLVAIAGLVVYQNGVTIPRLTQMAAAQLVSNDPFMLRNARDNAAPLAVPRNQPFSLRFDVPPANYGSYRVSVLTESGKVRLALGAIPADAARKTLEIVVAPNTLEPGKYVLWIEGADANRTGDVDRIPFEIAFQN